MNKLESDMIAIWAADQAQAIANMKSIPVTFYPADMCETCIRELDDLVTSGELSEVNERLEDLAFNGYSCPTCLQLEKDNN